MSRTNPAILFGFFVAIIVAMCVPSLALGNLYLGKHEGDTLHLLQIVLRMASGQWPHLDFMTPIGVLAFAPISLFVTLGFGAGMSIILGQALVATVLLPAVWWAAYSRMQGLTPYLFGLFVLVLATALVHGEAQRSVSISMHYNRWAWAVAFVAIVLAVVPNKGPARPNIDGFIIGAALAALALTKITYFAAFALPIGLALLLRRSFRAFLVAGLTGLVIAIAVTLMAGVGYWQAYLQDLLIVSTSQLRTQPSDSLSAVVGAPAYLAGSMVALAAVIFLRQSGEAIGGLILLLLVPGFFYVTFQNFGNDPQWLLLLGILLLCFRPESDLRNGLGWEMRSAIKVTVGVVFALSAASFFNLAYSPFRHLNTKYEDYTPLLPNSGVNRDILAAKIRVDNMDVRVPLDIAGLTVPANDPDDTRSELPQVNGETLPRCELLLGYVTFLNGIAQDLEQAGFAQGRRIMAADLFSNYWMFGSSEPLEKGAPWYYGGLPGIASADYLLVPFCPILQEAQTQILNNVDAAGYTLTELRRTDLYILFDIQEPQG